MTPLASWLLLLAPLAAAAPAPARYSVVLVLADGLRADRLGVYGAARPTSPGIDGRAKTAVVFERAYAAASWTLPSVMSVFTGLSPVRHGVLAPRRHLRPGTRLLAEVFRDSGYATAGFVGGHFLDPLFGFDRGFSLYRAKGQGRWGYLDETSANAARFIAARGPGEPFFVFIQGNDMHPPFGLSEQGETVRPRFDEGKAGGLVDRWLPDYAFVAAYNLGTAARDLLGTEPSAEYLAKVEGIKKDPGEMRRLVAHHDGRVANVDAAVETVFKALEASGRLKDTVVVLLSDHGLELGERGLLATAYHPTVAETVLRVPLLVWHPALAGARTAAPVSLQDLGATVLELAGLPPESLPGASFAGLARGVAEPAVRDVFAVSTTLGSSKGRLLASSLARGTWKLAYDHERGAARLYDLARDPDERRDVSALEPERARALREALDARLAEAPAGR